MDKDAAVLQGAFLRADQLSLLSSLQKAEWSLVGPVLREAVGEICGGDLGAAAVSWRRRIVCVLWLKLLSREAEEDVEAAWRENPLFALQNGLPDVSPVVLMELVKSMEAADVFAGFLLCFPLEKMCGELERLAEYVRSAPRREEDLQLLLEVWWELWKGREELEVRGGGGGESTEEIFTKQLTRLSSKSSGLSPQAAKRLKLETKDSLPDTDLLHILLRALEDMKDQLTSPDLCCQALSVSLNALYTSFLIDREVVLPPRQKMHILSRIINTRGRSHPPLSPEEIRRAQRDLQAAHTPAHFRPSRTTLREALRVVTELAEFWQSGGILRREESCSPFRLQLERSLQRVLAALDAAAEPGPAGEGGERLRAVLSRLDLSSTESSPEVSGELAAAIITHRLQDHRSVALLFAGEASLMACEESWLDCLSKNQTAFQQYDTLMSLSATLRRKLCSGTSELGHCRKLLKIIADVFSALPLHDKNQALAAMLRSSTRGFFHGPVPSTLTDAFQQELNMAFNCIIQGGGVTPQGSLNTAVSLVARVAFQNPEAALRSCCQSALCNKGAFTLMAQILQQLPGLRAARGGSDGGDQSGGGDQSEGEDGTRDEGEDVLSGSGLLCRCLQDVVGTRSLSASEKEQFLHFLSLLMTPLAASEGGDTRQSFLSPQEVVSVFVLPNISAAGQSSVDAELSLQILHAALSVDVQEEKLEEKEEEGEEEEEEEEASSSSPHWVMHCSPFPLLYVLAQLHNQTLRFWEQPPGGAVLCSVESRELLVTVLTRLGCLLGAEVCATPSRWSRALFWFYNRCEQLDWTVRLLLKPVWGQHFRHEVPSTLLAVCQLPEQEWSGLELSPYGAGTGLLAWMECCCVSESLCSTMLSCLSLDRSDPDQVGLFSKGVLVALTQLLPCCSPAQWRRLLEVVRKLLASARLHVPFSLEYVDYLPLLDLRRFSCQLRLSVLLLRVLQLLCGSSCSHWLEEDGWAHVARLYALAIRDIMSSIRDQLPLPSSKTTTESSRRSTRATSESSNPEREAGGSPLKGEAEEEVAEEAAPSQEVLFVLSQLYCHVQHIQVMMPGGQSEPLFLCSLEILAHYGAILSSFPGCCSSVESDNTRHFFSTITDNLQSLHMKSVLQQKIAQLGSAAA